MRARASGWAAPSCGELREIVDAECLFELGDLGDGVLEAVVAEHFLLLVLELIAELRVGLRADEGAQLREQHRVLASGVWAVHVIEAVQDRRELAAIAVDER